MPIQNAPLLAFNRGLVDALGLARIDIKRLALSAEVMTNWMPRSLGSMMLRPGLAYIGGTKSNAKAKHIPFIKRSIVDQAVIEITNGVMRVRVADTIISRGSVSTAITNGAFTTDLADWTDADQSGATSAWATGGYLSLIGTRYNSAIRRQEVTVAAGDQGDEHGLHIVVHRGTVTLKVGSTAGADDYISETPLVEGVHSLALTPTGNFHIELSGRTQAAALVDSIAIEAAGDMEITVPWDADDLPLLRWWQSADVVFVACDGKQQRKIERRSVRSWSVVTYLTDDGPFRITNTSTTRLTGSALTGDITLTASASLFKSTHVGGLFKITSVGQKVEADIGDEAQWSDSIRVSGVDSGRVFQYSVAGTWAGTVTVQRSVGEEGAWVDVFSTASNVGLTNYDDTFDNQIIYYRIGIDTGDYTSGTAEVSLVFPSGGITGIVRVTAYTSATVVSAAVIRALGSTSATEDWSEGIWSDYRGWPSSLSFFDGRLWWHGSNWNIGSVSDAYASFDSDVEGDAGPIIRTIGFGPVDLINWGLPMQRLILGAEGSEISVRSSSLDEPLTPTSYNAKEASTEGSSNVQAVRIGEIGIYADASGARVNSLEFDPSPYDYVSKDLSVLVPNIGLPSITHISTQKKPDWRIHVLRSDGTAAMMLFHKAEEVKCWVELETDGEIEDSFRLPGTGEDAVYYCVKRTIGGSPVRYLEKWAKETECIGGTLNKQADSFAIFTNTPAAASVPAATCSHLVGETVVVWADGKCLADANGDIATFTVAANGGIAALTHYGAAYTATTGVVGLPYTAQFKSAKLAFAAVLGTALGQRQRISNVALLLANTHYQGIEFGPDFTTMDTLPLVVDGAVVAQDTVHSTFDQDALTFPGDISTDTRLCLQAKAPRCVTVLAAVVGIGTLDAAP